MFTINFKGEVHSNRPEFVKIRMIIYKPGYPRAEKVLAITGFYKDWDQKKQRFKGRKTECASLNVTLSELANQYIQVGNSWEQEGVKWTPRSLSHFFNTPQKNKLEQDRVLSVEEMYEQVIKELKAKKKINGAHEVSSSSYAMAYEYNRRWLRKFTREHYGRIFSTYYFNEITENFLYDYVYYIEKEGIKNGNKCGLRGKLHFLYQIVKKAERAGMPGADVRIFDCTAEKFRENRSEPKTIPLQVMMQIENIDRSMFAKTELFHIDMFLFCFYCGGMAPVDAGHLTWNCIDKKARMITYERMKTTRKAMPPFPPKAEKIVQRYKNKCYKDYVLPIMTSLHQTETQRRHRMNYMIRHVNLTLKRVAQVIGYNENLTWYACRGTYITMLIDRQVNPYAVAEHAGNSPYTIFKNYWKNTHREDIIAELCEEMT